jgi:hypothetical protein
VGTDTVLSRREATLRSGATTCLAGIALVQAIELPILFVQGRQLAVLSMAGMVLCVALGWALAAAPADAGARLWRLIAATAVLVLAGWAAPRAFAVPGLSSGRVAWGTMPGLVSGGLGAICLVLAVAAVRPSRAAARGLATAAVVLIALAPGAGVLIVALGPGTAGGETVLSSGGHIHAHGSGEAAIEFQALPGGGGHYVYRAVATPHQTPLALALLVTMAFVFVYGAVVYLRRRSAPREDRAAAPYAEGALA